MRGLYLILIFLLSVKSIYAIRAPSHELNIEKRREEQEKLRVIQELSKNKLNEEKDNFRELMEPKKEIGTRINKIIIKDNSVISSLDLRILAKKYIGRRGGVNIINLLKEIENLYLKRGYIAARVKIDMQSSDFKNGVVAYKILEGKIEKFTFKDESKYDNKRVSFSFPCEKGDIINIKDLDQGIDNLNSILSNNAKFSLLPGEELGGTVIEIENKMSKKVSGAINYNNLGQSSTGEERGKVSLTYSDVLGFNDSFTGSFQRKTGKNNEEKDNYNFSFNYRIPYKYWEFSVSKDRSEYLSTINALNTKYKSNGLTKSVNYGVRRVLHRNKDSKTDIGLTLTNKECRNYIEDIKLITGSRKLSILKFDINTQRKFFSGILYGNLACHKGLDRMGAERDDKKEYDVPRAQFIKYTADLNWYKPFKIKEQDFAYRFSFSGQYSDDILYSSEKLSIGDDTTVRGFKENSIMGDKGFYVRNELSYKFKMFEPFVAYDIGRVKDVTKDNFYKENGSEISGASIGLRVSYNGFNGSITYSKPVTAPNYIHKNSQELYVSISYSF